MIDHAASFPLYDKASDGFHSGHKKRKKIEVTIMGVLLKNAICNALSCY
jgi:hypothetical protein